MPTSDETLKSCGKDCGGYVCKFHSLEPTVQEHIAQLEAALTLIGDIVFDSDGYAGNAEKMGALVGEIYGYARNPQTAVDALKESG